MKSFNKITKNDEMDRYRAFLSLLLLYNQRARECGRRLNVSVFLKELHKQAKSKR